MLEMTEKGMPEVTGRDERQKSEEIGCGSYWTKMPNFAKFSERPPDLSFKKTFLSNLFA